MYDFDVIICSDGYVEIRDQYGLVNLGSLRDMDYMVAGIIEDASDAPVPEPRFWLSTSRYPSVRNTCLCAYFDSNVEALRKCPCHKIS